MRAKHTALHVLGLALLVLAVLVSLFAWRQSASHDDDTATSSGIKAPKKANRACQIFTLSDARTLLGESAKTGQSPADATSPDLNVSTCTYTQPNGTGVPVSERKSASLLARIPKTEKGTNSNQSEFGPLKPTTVQDVPGYGEQAFWDADHGQLNILKNNNWYILSFGSVSPDQRSLQETQQMADLLIVKL
ncbi:hypothetical protein KW792_00625 [Candidatus Saccharibacteria bacterium]|nr:hypothetical protein [Candidatus Saccharibacteria bacterium]